MDLKTVDLKQFQAVGLPSSNASSVSYTIPIAQIPNPKDKQIDGNHYKQMVIQPIDFIVKNKIPYMEANAIKYLVRHQSKGQRKDLEKAIHYIELAIQHYYGNDISK